MLPSFLIERKVQKRFAGFRESGKKTIVESVHK